MKGAIAKRISVLLGLALLAAFGVGLVRQFALTYPTPETESIFLKTYTPEEAMKPFVNTQRGGQQQGGTTSSAGRGVANHEKHIEAVFVIPADERAHLVSALRENLVTQLENNGARILQTHDACSGLELKYVAGKTKGTVTLQPLETVQPDHIDRASTSKFGPLAPLCAGEQRVLLRISIAEKWYKSASS